MARLVTAGGEIRDHPTIDVGSPDGYTPSAVPTVTDTLVVRSGFASWRCAGSATSASYRAFPFAAPASGTNVYARAYFQADTLPTVTTAVVAFLTAADGALVSVRLTPAGTFELWNDATGTQIGSDTNLAVVAGQACRVLLRLKIGVGSVDEAEMRVRADDPQMTDEVVSGTALGVSDTHAARLRVGWLTAPGVDSNLNADDVAVNNDTGTKQNTWPGDGVVVYQVPVTDGISLGSWTDCSGAASIKNGLNKLPPVGLADHTNAAHTGAACHQVRVAVNTAQTANGYFGSPALAGAPTDLLLATSTSPSATNFGTINFAPIQVAQTFNFGAAVTITAIGANLYKNGSPTDGVVLEIRSNNAGVPSDVVLATTAPIPAASLLASAAPLFVRASLLSPFTTTPGTTYWLVIRRTGARDDSNTYGIGTPAGTNFAEGTEAELGTDLKTWTLSQPSKVAQLAFYTTYGSLVPKVMLGVVCHGEAAAGVKAGTATFVLTSGSQTASFNYGNDVGIAGTYPTNWRWAQSPVLYDVSPLKISQPLNIGKASGSGTVACLICALGIVSEYQPPQPGAWRRVQKVADSTFWQAKLASGPSTAELAGGGTVTAESGDWMIYPEPQIAAGSDLPATTTTITSDALNTGYVDA
jgi:hypothetical protein